MLKYERCTASDWYVTTDNNHLYRISAKARIHRRTRIREMKRARHVLKRLGYGLHFKYRLDAEGKPIV